MSALDGGVRITIRPAVPGAIDVAAPMPEDAERLAVLARTLLERNAQLETALESRIVIEQAKGVLVERYRLEPQAAFELLRRGARTSRVRIRDLAARVVASRETPSELARLVPPLGHER